MQKHQEINRLLLQLSRITDDFDEGTAYRNIERRRETLRNHIDLTPYRHTRAWPGHSYILIGNSFNAEVRVNDPTHYVRRAACISLLLEQGKNYRYCVPVHDALQNEGFVSVLSRFERDWLVRLPDTSLIGPAYDEKGKLIAQAFAVWKKEMTAVYSSR